MATVVKDIGPNVAKDFRDHELMQILLVGRVNGWEVLDKGIEVFEKTDATQLYTALKRGLSELEGNL